MKTKQERWWDVAAALFLAGALFSAAIRLTLTNWTPHLDKVGVLTFLGLAAGLALGKSRYRGLLTFGIGLAYTAFILPWQLGTLTPNMDWLPRMNILYARLWYATADVIRNKPVHDSILFLTAMLLLFWLVSLLSSYHLVRNGSPWAPLLSLGVMVVVIEYTLETTHARNIGAGSYYSFAFLLFNLLLMGRLYFMHSRQEWQQRGGTIELEVGYDLGRGVAVAAVVLALLAWNTPQIINLFDEKNPGRERISQEWQAFRDRINKATNSLRSDAPAVVQSYSGNMFLGTSGNQSAEIQFLVKPDNGRVPIRMYWAGRTYDSYQAGQWQTTLQDTRALGPTSVPMVYPTWAMRHIEQFTFTTKTPLLRTLYFTDAPINVNRPVQAIMARAAGGAEDLNAITVDPPLKADDPYVVRAEYSTPTILAMRDEGTDYPDWVKQRYLQLPDNFSTRITDLARQIAGQEPTPYDKALAITQYLRRTITYSISIPEPPRNRDPLEWFLFEQRTGFCNYYASAEVMMLRAVGVPARLVVGYAEGEWVANLDSYVVRGKDSHAWPEVYFPRLGWVTFEPTVSQPANDFPQGEALDNTPASSGQTVPTVIPTFDPLHDQDPNRADQLLAEEEAARSRLQQRNRDLPWIISLGGLGLLAVGMFLLERRRRQTTDLPFISWLEKWLDESGLRTPAWLRGWSRQAMRTPMENLFASVGSMLRIWGQPVAATLTPAEQVAYLVRVVPGVEEQAAVLLQEYQRAMYSQYPANTARARLAVKDIRAIGYRNWFMRLIGLETAAGK